MKSLCSLWEERNELTRRKEVLPERRMAPSRNSSYRGRMARIPREASRPKVSYIQV